jgi:hypothetical protein
MMSLVAFVVALASAVSSPQPGREQRCTRWTGTVSGNDPSVRVAATLCEQDGKITGVLEWKSDKSGTSTRQLAGVRSGDAIVLHDTSLTGTPNPGWRFCPIDEYKMSGAGTDRLSGSYLSTRCRDRATIDLRRVR